VATAALDRGHEVATFTRGVSRDPPAGARALHGDRDDPAALPEALGGWTSDLVVDTSCQEKDPRAPRHSLARAGTLHGGRSLDAHVDFSLGPIDPRTASRPGRPTTTSTGPSRTSTGSSRPTPSG
jgi:hypothetical protein